MVVQLKIRDIKTGKAQVAEFESVDDAETWLRERPRFVEVLGPPREGALSPDEDQRLRQAMRPLDDEERLAQIAQDERDAAAMRKMMEQQQQRMRDEMEARREEARHADPNRPITVAWERSKGMRNADPVDDRPITDAARTAVLAWVAERDSWVHSRGQFVASAQLVVWPGPIPGGNESERVHPGGQFEVLAGTPPDIS